MFKNKKAPNPPLEFIVLDEKDFSCLVRGGILHVGNLRIVLSDIGFNAMDDAIHRADMQQDLYKDHVKEKGFIV